MDCASLSDVELLRLIRGGAETSAAASEELEQRHFQAVRAFASVCAAAPSAVGDLARQSWDAAMWQQEDGGASGAVRPNALSAVLRTASGWVQGAQRGTLDAELAAWCEANDPAMSGNPTARSRTSSSVARAFAGLSDRSQTILWHQTVERDDPALTGRLLGVESGEVSALAGRVRTELHNSYVRILQDGMRDDCRRFHQMVLVYSDTRSVDAAAELAPHLKSCTRCSEAVSDLGRMQRDCGALLAEALLPWGGRQYAANHSADEDADQEIITFGAAVPGIAANESAANGSAANASAANGRAATGDPKPESPGSDSLKPDLAASEALATELWTTVSPGNRAPARRRNVRAIFAAVSAGARTKNRRRADIAVRCAAVVGVCAAAGALAFAFPSGEPQSKDSARPAKVSPSSKPVDPSPTKSKPKPKPTKTTKAPPKKKKPSDAPPPSRPPVGNAAVEWLFDDVNGRVTPDTSGNNQNGTLFSASPAGVVSGGVLNLNGGQFVASRQPLVDTNNSFSVSARVRLNNTDDSQTVVSQDASETSGFLLQFDEDDSQWEMRMPEEDDDDADSEAAASGIEPQPGVWTHLTGVYDDDADELRLYVDGRLAEVVDRDEDFESEGAFVVGRGFSDGEFTNGVEGAVDDVRAFGRAISSAEVQALARKP